MTNAENNSENDVTPEMVEAALDAFANFPLAWEYATPDSMKAAIAAAIRVVREAGYVIVPRTPTQSMIDAAHDSALGEDARGVWNDMIEAIKR